MEQQEGVVLLAICHVRIAHYGTIPQQAMMEAAIGVHYWPT